MTDITEKMKDALEAAANEAHDYTNMPMEVDPRDFLELTANIRAQQPDAGLDVEAVLRRFLTWDGYIAECDIQHIVAALTAQPAICGHTCTVPDDCETLHWRGQILSMNELASVAQPAAGEEIMVNAAHDVYTLPLQPSGLSSGPRFVVHVPQTETQGSDDVQLDAAKSTAAIAWGWLWHVTTADDRVKTARHLLGQMLDKDLKRYGIQNAKDEGAQVNVQEIEAAMLRGEFGDA